MRGAQTKICFEKRVKALRMKQKGAQTSTLWPKTETELVTMNVDKFQERQNASIVCGPTALVLKKVRHGEAKTEAELATVIISEFQKLENASIACRPTAPARKMRHVGQSKKETDRFGHANPYHADFDISNSLCR